MNEKIVTLEIFMLLRLTVNNQKILANPESIKMYNMVKTDSFYAIF